MSSNILCTDYEPFIPPVLQGFGFKPSDCNITANSDEVGTVKMSYTINWKADEHCLAMASLALNNGPSESKKILHCSRRRSSKHKESRSASTRSNRASSASRRRSGCRAKETKKGFVQPDPNVVRRHRSTDTVLRKGGVTPQPNTEVSVVGIPSPTTKLVEVHLEVIDGPPDTASVNRSEMRREVNDKERLMPCIEKMLDIMGATMNLDEHRCPIRLYYKRKQRLRPISFDDYRKMTLNNFHALDGTLNFVVDKVKAIDV